MLLHVLHETRYDYQPGARNAQHVAHLRPRELPHQQLLRHALRIEPAPADLHERVDALGNSRCYFSLPALHERLSVVADSLVQTHPVPAPAPGLPWEQARDALRYRQGALWDPAGAFQFPSPYVPRHPDFIDYARPSFTADRPLMEVASDLMQRIHADFRYEATATDVGTPAVQALAMRSGVCQDFAHIMIACLRCMGLSARYVSGYLLTAPAPGQPLLVGADASHAWVSVWSPGAEGGQWHDLDPTNNRQPGEDYVTLAIGRDYSDISPVRGVIHGGERHTLHVGVTVVPVTEASTEITA